MKNICFILFAVLSLVECKAQKISGSYSYEILIGGLDSLYEAIEQETILPNSCEQTETGRVIVKYLINEKGVTKDMSVLNGICPAADSVALEIVNRLKYKPATKNGEPVGIQKTIPIFFKKEE